jgi:hypothetical protein
MSAKITVELELELTRGTRDLEERELLLKGIRATLAGATLVATKPGMRTRIGVRDVKPKRISP